jgi:hypothetical protein
MQDKIFFVNSEGKLIFKGEVFKVNTEYHFLSEEQKSEILILLINWANDEMEGLNQKKKDSWR